MHEISAEEWGQLREDVGYIKANVETAIAQGGDHETRIRRLERFKQRALGGVALLTFLGTIAGVLIAAL